MVGSAGVWDQTHGSMCGICFVQIDKGIGASSGTAVLLLQCFFASDPYLYLIHLRPVLYTRPWQLRASLKETLKIYGGMTATWTTEELSGGKVEVGLREKRVRF
jgi:hypothetical protein